MKMIKLKNGETIVFAVGLVHNIAIRDLFSENPAAFKVLVSACRNAQYTIPLTPKDKLEEVIEALQAANLIESIDDKGRFVIHSTIRSVVLSAAVGNESNLEYVSPFEGDD